MNTPSERINQIYVWFLFLPSRVYGKAGADLDQLKKILSVKLMLDDRNPTGLFKPFSRGDHKPFSAGTLLILFFSMLYGGVICFLFLFNDPGLRMLLYYSMYDL